MKRKYLVWLLIASLTACTEAVVNLEPEGGVRAWIDHPRDGEVFMIGETIPIRWHASAPEGIQQVEVRIDGEILAIALDFDHTTALVTQQHVWTPSSLGQHLIEVVSTSNTGALSKPTSNIITVTDATITNTASPTTVDTNTPKPSRTNTLTPTQTSTLTPTHTLTSTPTPTLTSTPTPTKKSTSTYTPLSPTPDTLGPPKPNVIGPKDNEIIDCPPRSVTLDWQASYDPSGIAGYWVELYSWPQLDLIESWGMITDTELFVQYPLVDCGTSYAWKVWARDGAGNDGAYELVGFQMGLD